MKTITTKDALKLFLFLLILCSAKMFALPKLPNDAGSGDCESKVGCVKKEAPKTSCTTYSAAKGNGAQAKANTRFKK